MKELWCVVVAILMGVVPFLLGSAAVFLVIWVADRFISKVSEAIYRRDIQDKLDNLGGLFAAAFMLSLLLACCYAAGSEVLTRLGWHCP